MSPTRVGIPGTKGTAIEERSSMKIEKRWTRTQQLGDIYGVSSQGEIPESGDSQINFKNVKMF